VKAPPDCLKERKENNMEILDNLRRTPKVLYLELRDKNIIPVKIDSIVYIGYCGPYPYASTNQLIDIFLCIYDGGSLRTISYSSPMCARELIHNYFDPWCNYSDTGFFKDLFDYVFYNSAFSYYKNANHHWVNVTTKADKTKIIGKFQVVRWEFFEKEKNRYYEYFPRR
jgi:hypothetical protein